MTNEDYIRLAQQVHEMDDTFIHYREELLFKRWTTALVVKAELVGGADNEHELTPGIILLPSVKSITVIRLDLSVAHRLSGAALGISWRLPLFEIEDSVLKPSEVFQLTLDNLYRRLMAVAEQWRIANPGF